MRSCHVRHPGVWGREVGRHVPDAPVSRFELTLKGGEKYGLLENSTDLCRQKHRATANYTGQNGKTYNAKPVLQVKCKRHVKKKHKHKRARR